MSDANNRLNELLISQIEKFDGALDKAVDFAAEQTPDLIQQLLLWNMTISGLGFILCITLMIGLVVAYMKIWKGTADFDEYDRSNTRFGSGLLIGTVTLLSFFGIIGNLDWLKILIAPKLYLLEYAAELVR